MSALKDENVSYSGLHNGYAYRAGIQNGEVVITVTKFDGSPPDRVHKALQAIHDSFEWGEERRESLRAKGVELEPA